MQSGRILAILTVVPPMSLSAPSAAAPDLYLSPTNNTPGGRSLAGFGLSLGSASVSLRGSFGISTEAFSSSSTAPQPNSGRWSGDADLIIDTDILGLGRVF